MEKAYKVLKLLILVLLMAVLILGAYVLYERLGSRAQTQVQTPSETEAPGETEKPRTPAPDLSFTDLEGSSFALSDFRGKPVILNFWASWCGYCKMEMPDFQTAFDSYGEQIHFLMMNLTDGRQETKESGTAYLSEQTYTFPVYFTEDMEGVNAYGIYGLPATYFIDSEGNVVAQARGMLSAEGLRQGIDALLEDAD